jgi:hypothetical protein
MHVCAAWWILSCSISKIYITYIHIYTYIYTYVYMLYICYNFLAMQHLTFVKRGVHVQAVKLLQQCMSTLIARLSDIAQTIPSAAQFPAKGSTGQFAITEMMHRVAVFFQNLGRCPGIVSDTLPQVRSPRLWHRAKWLAVDSKASYHRMMCSAGLAIPI